MTLLYPFELKLGSKQPSCCSHSVIAIQLAVMGAVHRQVIARRERERGGGGEGVNFSQ